MIFLKKKLKTYLNPWDSLRSKSFSIRRMVNTKPRFPLFKMKSAVGDKQLYQRNNLIPFCLNIDKGFFQIIDQIIDIFNADTQTD